MSIDQSGFDTAAASYDEQFSHTNIGQFQRERVWQYLDKTFSKAWPQTVLELNCGTGIDALHFSSRGSRVLATDLSQEMLKETQAKLLHSNAADSVTLTQLDLADPQLPNAECHHLIFSNFGGINCINVTQLRKLAEFCFHCLHPGGHCIFVVMPQNTLFDRWYRFAQGQSEVYKQRAEKHQLEVSLGDATVSTYYHNASDIINTFEQFEFVDAFTVGLLPSYLESSRFLKVYQGIERFLLPILKSTKYSDHFLIHLKK